MGSTEYGLLTVRNALIKRGLRLIERFKSQAEVELNGGTVYGTPTFERGVTLNGTTDYIVYNNNIKFSNQVSFIFSFTPNFAKNDSVLRFFFDSNAANRYNFYKDSTNDLYFFAGAFFGVVTYANYQAYWQDYGINTFAILMTATDLSITLNGTQVLNTSSAAWTEKKFDTLVIGARTATYSLKFKGIFHNFNVFNSALSASETEAHRLGSMWDYMRPENCVLYMDGRAKHHDPTNFRILDTSGNNNHVDKGDGAGTGEPTKRNGLGYTFDGVDDYIGLPDRTSKFPYMYLQIAGVDQLSTSTAVYDSILASGGFSGIVYAIGLFNTDLNATQIIDFQSFININEVGA